MNLAKRAGFPARIHQVETLEWKIQKLVRVARFMNRNQRKQIDSSFFNRELELIRFILLKIIQINLYISFPKNKAVKLQNKIDLQLSLSLRFHYHFI